MLKGCTRGASRSLISSTTLSTKPYSSKARPHQLNDARQYGLNHLQEFPLLCYNARAPESATAQSQKQGMQHPRLSLMTSSPRQGRADTSDPKLCNFSHATLIDFQGWKEMKTHEKMQRPRKCPKTIFCLRNCICMHSGKMPFVFIRHYASVCFGSVRTQGRKQLWNQTRVVAMLDTFDWVPGTFLMKVHRLRIVQG